VPAGRGEDALALDDRPLQLQQSRDRKRLLVTLPHEIVVVDVRGLEALRSIELDVPCPSVAEDAEGLLWIGGRHLLRGSTWGSQTTKVGSRLGGLVDRVVLLRPDLLCGAGSEGEVLWNPTEERAEHRRKVGERVVESLIATADERAVWADGGPSAWVIDPAHPQGYTQLRLRSTSLEPTTAEGIVRLGSSTTGRCLLAARDGSVAWTHADLRLAGERFLTPAAARPAIGRPLDVGADERWLYVLRPRGLLHRFLLEQPRPVRAEPERPTRGRPPVEESPPLPDAQSCRLARPAECMALVVLDPEGVRLAFGGAVADGHLGRLWLEDPEQLEWRDLELAPRRPPADPAPPPVASGAAAPRSRPDGAPIAQLRVDDVLSIRSACWVTTDHGPLPARPTRPGTPEDVLPADTVLLPAMIRLHEGTARPALLVWPAAGDDPDEPARPTWLTWGDRPAGWIPLETPAIRAQGWTRSEVFPLQIALPGRPALSGRRAELPERWLDPEHFHALVRECKKLLKVSW
jgi:hypothetical protein